MQYRKRYKRIAAALVWAALASFAHAADALPEAAKALKKNATVQAVPAPPHINRQVASQHIATARAKAIAPAVQAQAQVNAYPPLTVTTQPMPTLPAAVTQARSKAAAAQQQPVQQRSTATTTSFTPLCPTLAINTAYTLSGTQPGGAYCYHFAITQRSKSTAFLTGQSSATDFGLLLLQDDGANNLSVVGASDNPGNANEIITALTQPGNYYWYMIPNSTDGAPFDFGVAVNTQIDDYEMNDTLPQATVLPDKLNTILANSDDPSDIDYYQFTSVRGQDVVISLAGVTSGTSSRWKVAFSGDGVNWTNLPNDIYNTISGFAQNQPIYVRVQHNTPATWSAAAQYELLLGSRPATGSHIVSGESSSSLSQIPLITTKVLTNLGWTSTIRDSKGATLPGALVYFIVGIRSNSNVYDATTNFAGQIFESINLGSCSGSHFVDYMIYSGSYSYPYRAYYDSGAWRIVVAGNPDAGVGGDNVPTVTFAQICSIQPR